MNKIKFSTIELTRTALMIALLIVVQLITKTLGQYITGSLVNFILASSSLLFGLKCSFVVALLSPFLAFMLGIGTPIIQLVPFIALGNIVYVLLICSWKEKMEGKVNGIIAIIISSIFKFLTLYILITKVVLPLLGLPEAKVAALSVAFSWLQLFTALIGGLLAYSVIPQLSKLKKRNSR